MRSIAGLGIFMFAIGLYFLPFGYDALLAIFLMAVDQNYWRATIMMYAMSIGLMFTGLAIAGSRLDLGRLNVIKSPMAIGAALLFTGLLFVVVIYLP